MDVERQDEPLDDRRGEAGVGLDEVAGLLPHVLDVEHVVQVAVLVADQVEHHVAVVLVGVDVVEDHQGVAIETRGDGLPCLSVDDVEQGLRKEREREVTQLIIKTIYALCNDSKCEKCNLNLLRINTNIHVYVL